MARMACDTRNFNFQGNPVRCVGTDRDLWFVARDVCEALGIAWRGLETLENIPVEWRGVRKLRTPQSNQHGLGNKGFMENDVIVITEAALYKLAFRSNKPGADAFTNWVANEVLPSIRKTGVYVSPRKARYVKTGKSLEWAGEREEGISVRKELTATLQRYGVTGQGYSDCTNAIYWPILGGTAKSVRTLRGLPQSTDLRDELSRIELARVKLAELMAAERIATKAIVGNARCEQACVGAGNAVAAATRAYADGVLA